MHTNEKVKWLQKHYGNYSTEWYLSNLSRLDAIFYKHYNTSLELAIANTKSIQNTNLSLRQLILETEYLEEFGTNFTDDMKKDKQLVAERLRTMKRRSWSEIHP